MARKSIGRYVAALLVGGAASLLFCLQVLPRGDLDVVPTIALGVLAVISIALPLRFHHEGGIQGFNLEGAVLVALLFAVPGAWAPIVLVAASLVGYGLRVRDPMKVGFNVGQDAIWASAGTLAFHAIGPADEILATSSIIAVAVTIAVEVTVNGVLLGELFHRLDGRPRARAVLDVTRLHGIVYTANVAYGMLFAFLVATDVWAVGLAGLLVAGQFVGSRGYAAIIEERVKSEQLHRLSQLLVESPETEDSLMEFLGGVTELMGASGALMRLGSSDSATELAWELSETQRTEGGKLAATIAHSGQAVSDQVGDVAALGAPLIARSQRLGSLLVLGRRGLEPWDEGDVELISSLANEAAVALKNIELFRQVERERARWEAESTKLGDIVNAASDGIAMLSSEGTIETWNEAMVAITGLPAEQALGQPWFVVLRLRGSDDEELLPGADHIVSRAVEGRRYREPVDLQVLRRDGSWRYLRATFAPVHHEDAHPGGTVMVARDVTAEREVEALKADFVATVSHELRTPLTPLRGFLQTLVAHRHQLDEDQVETIYGSMDSQLGRLERLIADLLVVADLDRGATKLQVEQVNLLEAVTIAVRNEASSDNERVDISGQDDVVVAGDGKAVVRVIRALASNALKHTEDRVEVHAERVESQGVVRVRDHGPGIPPWEQKEIFKRFRRLGDHLTRNQGPGLGLPIAAALAERLGGRVTVESDVAEGSVFSLWLPLARPRVVDSVGSDTQAS